MDGRTDGWMDGWMDGRMDGLCVCALPYLSDPPIQTVTNHQPHTNASPSSLPPPPPHQHNENKNKHPPPTHPLPQKTNNSMPPSRWAPRGRASSSPNPTPAFSSVTASPPGRFILTSARDSACVMRLRRGMRCVVGEWVLCTWVCG
jgi:hypothetical protein